MNKYGRILTIQDISCVGQCSLTVALPIISACGHETVILPSAILSTHTGGFTGYTFRDLTDDMPKIVEHWKKEGITFDAVYTGYLGNKTQIEVILDAFNSLLRPNGIRIVDPAMADNGKLYYGFDDSFVEAMKGLVAKADVVLPNITEASMLTGVEYATKYDVEYVRDISNKLKSLGAKSVVLTGVKFDDESTGVFVSNSDGEEYYYRHKLIDKNSHGTGDIYASVFTGAIVKGFDVNRSAEIAADFTVKCIENTLGDDKHWYGVKFEQELGFLTEKLNRKTV